MDLYATCTSQAAPAIHSFKVKKPERFLKAGSWLGSGRSGGGQLWKYEILKDLEDLDAQYTFGTFGMEHGSMMVSKFDAWN